jgi:hypothetical protein
MTTRGMNAAKLSARRKQPGHDRDFLESESAFVTVARASLDPTFYLVQEKPKDLRDLFPKQEKGERDLGVEPEAVIINKVTKRRLYVEVKAQGERGNAEERACKHHTVQFYKTLNLKFGYDYHPIITIFCESLATFPRYTRKHPYFFEPGQYFNWIDYQPSILAAFLKERCALWLED